MKRLVLLIVVIALMQLVFSCGVLVGLCVRLDPSRPAIVSDRKELPCTCVQCLPDLYCLKCGHKSRDCPKLAHIFKKGTNILNAVSAPVK